MIQNVSCKRWGWSQIMALQRTSYCTMYCLTHAVETIYFIPCYKVVLFWPLLDGDRAILGTLDASDDCRMLYKRSIWNNIAKNIDILVMFKQSFLHTKPWILVGGNRYSPLLFTSKDRICANLRQSARARTIDENRRRNASTSRSRDVTDWSVVTSHCQVRKDIPWWKWRSEQSMIVLAVCMLDQGIK